MIGARVELIPDHDEENFRAFLSKINGRKRLFKPAKYASVRVATTSTPSCTLAGRHLWSRSDLPRRSLAAGQNLQMSSSHVDHKNLLSDSSLHSFLTALRFGRVTIGGDWPR